MKKFIAFALITGPGFLFFAGCGNKTVDPPLPPAPAAPVYLEKLGKYLIGDEVWARCTTTVSSANARVLFNFNRSDDNAWQELAVQSTEGSAVKVALPSYNVTRVAQGYSKIRVMDKTDTSKVFLIDSLVVSRILLIAPKDGDTVKVGQHVAVQWKYAGSSIQSLNIKVYVNGHSNNLLSNNSAPIDAPFEWIVGQEPVPITYAGTAQCIMEISDYGASSENVDRNFKPFFVKE
jgi:hypothetical protein